MPAALVSGAMDADVSAMQAAVLTASAIAAGAIDAGAIATDAVAEIADWVWDEAKSGHTTGGTFGESYGGVVNSTAKAGGTTTTVETNLTEGSDNHYNDRTIVWITGALAGQAASVTDYVGDTKALTVSAMTEAAGNGDQFVLV